VKQTVEELQAAGVEAFGSALNARDADAYRAWLAQACTELGGLDILVASLSAGGGMDSERNWYKNFEIDLMGAVRAVETVLPHLKKSDAASIVIVATMAASETFVGPMAYNAMKAALLTYSKQLSQAVAKRGIRVNAISPGPTTFEGSAWEMVAVANRKLYSGVIKQQPQRRLAHVDEIAKSIVFVASPAASWMQGSHLLVDGGYSKRVQF
jgi:3-oxoacyl-[acyl-carrier protein] reductase